jgi:hypothetical protein
MTHDGTRCNRLRALHHTSDAQVLHQNRHATTLHDGSYAAQDTQNASLPTVTQQMSALPKIKTEIETSEIGPEN